MVQKTVRALCLSALLVLSGAAQAQGHQGQPDGPVFSPEQMRQGITMGAGECAAYRSTVFVTVQGQGLCFRYYLSTAGGTSSAVVYYLEGDKSPEQYAFDPAKFDERAARMSADYRMPAVYLARMGLDGSSGWHRYRRTWFEVEATSRAIDAINARHGFGTVHVMGQSGGGHLTGSLIGVRGDVGCALPGSGRLAFDEEYVRSEARKRDPALRHYDPHTRLAEVVRNSIRARILVVTDPADKRVPAAMQTGFVRDVQRAGGRIAQFFVTATDELSHGSTPYIRVAMKGCLQGASDGEIGAKLTALSAERWTHEIARRQVAPAGTVPPTAWASGRPAGTAAPAPVPVRPAPFQPRGSFRMAGSPPPPPPAFR